LSDWGWETVQCLSPNLEKKNQRGLQLRNGSRERKTTVEKGIVSQIVKTSGIVEIQPAARVELGGGRGETAFGRGPGGQGKNRDAHC